MNAAPTAASYVPITRHFREVQDDPTDGFTRRMLDRVRGAMATTWRDLLLPYGRGPTSAGVVLIAPSGAGKSVEVARETQRLRQDGHAVFLCEAGAVATDGFRDALDGPSAAAFDEWLSGTDPAVLVVDAVDEVYLRQRKLRDVTHSLEKAIDFGKREVQIVVTVRTGAWSNADFNQLADLLRQRSAKLSIKTVTFEPLDSPALAALASAAGVNDVNAFLNRFEQDELYNLLDLRPRDVQLFVDYWNKYGAFGTWSQVLADFLEASFVETSSLHHSNQSLSLEEGSRALRRIAAASILTKKAHVTLPTSSAPPGAMDGRRLFADLEPRLLGELFGNGLFIHKGEAAVQLPQGALTQFLAAQWFGERFAKGWSSEQLRDALLVRVFDEQGWRLPASRLAMIGWVASEVPELRKLLLDEAPHVVLYGGDPSRLRSTEIASALRKIVERAAVEKHTPWPTKGTLRQLARPDLVDVVLGLLREYRGVAEVERHLFQYVELGRYETCVPHALEIALDRSADSGSRASAVSVVAAIGGASDKAALLELRTEASVEIRAELIRALVPDHLRGAPFVEFLLRTDDYRLCYLIGRVVDRVALDDVDATLQALLPTLQRSTVTAQTKSDFELAVVLLLSRLRRTAPLTSWLGDALVALEPHWDVHFVSEEARAEFETLFDSNVAARRAVWEALIRRDGQPDLLMSISHPRLCKLRVDDIVWLFEQREHSSLETQRELLWAIEGLYHSMPTTAREAVRHIADLPQELAARFEAIDLNGREAEARDRVRAEAKRLADEVLRTKNIAALEPDRIKLESGENVNLLVWGWKQLKHPDTEGERIALGELRQLVGEDLTQSFARGFKACWRRQQVPLPEPGQNGTPFSLLAGLTGLTLEIRDGLDLSTLTSAEAELAARYALRELNAFPYWLAPLQVAHPAAVERVLREVLESEWLASCEHHGVMRFAPLAPKEVGLIMRAVVLALAESRPAGNPKIVRVAGDALLVANDDSARVARLARTRVGQVGHEETAVLTGWLRVWANVDPVEAAEWLDGLRPGAADDFDRLVAGTAELLEQDFDDRSRTASTALMTPRALEKWVRLLHLAVRPADDVQHEGAHFVGQRDYAEDFRRRCVHKLSEDASLEAYRALERLRDDGDLAAYRGLLERATEAQLARAAEATATPWIEANLLCVERGDERRPNSLADLFRLVRRHLSLVGQLVENDDFSYRGLFKDPSEKEIQQWAASSLKLVSRGLYSVVREGEFDDNNKVDIVALVEGIGRLPIEIKPLGSYSVNALTTCVANQLYGKYMQPADVTHGVLLLVRHTNKEWEVDGKTQGLSALVDAVRAFAATFGMANDKVIDVVTIDLLKVGTSGKPRAS